MLIEIQRTVLILKLFLFGPEKSRRLSASMSKDGSRIYSAFLPTAARVAEYRTTITSEWSWSRQVAKKRRTEQISRQQHESGGSEMCWEA